MGFAERVIASCDLPESAVIFDPWNGSGTTSFAASDAGFDAIGFDLNPVMVVVARARMLPATEGDALQPIALQILQNAKAHTTASADDDPLLEWFRPATADVIRSLEGSIRRLLVGAQTITENGVDLSMLSSIAAACYVALFSTARKLAHAFRATNPTWIKVPRAPEERISSPAEVVYENVASAIREMAFTLIERRKLFSIQQPSNCLASISNVDSSTVSLQPESVDLILTSPPYCTRLDYARLTRIEMAILSGLVFCSYPKIKRELLGSVIAPKTACDPDERWGAACLSFLRQVKGHRSKASSGYYYRNHIDYFDKLFRSISHAASAMKLGGAGVFVVQDSFYKDVHNPLPLITSEMLSINDVTLVKQYDFSVTNSMAMRHRYAGSYRSGVAATESVLCVVKH